MQFLLGACFFVYLPLLPLMIIFCNWRRRVLAKKRLKKKAQRKKKRLLKVSAHGCSTLKENTVFHEIKCALYMYACIK